MTTSLFFLIPLRVFLSSTRVSWSIHTVDLCLWTETSDGPHAVFRRRGSILATTHQPNALRETESNASPPCPHSPPTPPYASPRRKRRHTLAVGTDILAGKGGAAPARGRGTMRKAAAAREGSAASARRRRRSTPGAKRPARAGAAWRQRGGGGAHQVQSGKSEPPALERRRSAQGAQWQPRASGAARHADGQRRRRRPTPLFPPARRGAARTRLCPRRAS